MIHDETPADGYALLASLGLGEHAALERLHQLYGARLLRRIRSMMGEKARRVAESGDFLNETFLQATVHLPHLELRGEPQLLRWLTEVARNRISDAVRRPREMALAHLSDSLELDREVAAAERTPSSVLDGRDALHRLAEAIESLREEDRTVIELRQLEELDFRAIGERLGRSENAAQLLHARALVKLNRKLRR